MTVLGESTSKGDYADKPGRRSGLKEGRLVGKPLVLSRVLRDFCEEGSLSTRPYQRLDCQTQKDSLWINIASDYHSPLIHQ